MVAPGLIVYLAIVAYPVGASVVLGLTSYRIAGDEPLRFIGFANYLRMFRDPLFWTAFRNTMIVVFVSVFGQIPIGFALAYILHRRLVAAPRFFQAMVFIPNFITTVVVGILWNRLLISPYGPVVRLLQMVTGNPRARIGMTLDPHLAMLPIAFVLIWVYTGFYMVIFLANLQKVDAGLLEAAQIDGAGEGQIFRRIILPMLSGVVFINAILSIAGSMTGFNLIWAMTKGGPANMTIVLPIYMYNIAFVQNEPDAYSFGCAISTVIVLISIALILISRLISRVTDATGEA